MRYLSLELLNTNLEKAQDAEFVTSVPKGFNDQFFHNFLKVMTLPNGTDDASISDEELVEMLLRGQELFETLDLSESVYNRVFTRLLGIHSHVPAMKRRVI